MMQVESFKPFGDRVVVKPHPKKEKTDGGIIIAQTVALEAEMGDVISIGEDVTMGSVGEVVLYPTGTGWELEVDKVKLKVIRQSQIEGVVS